MSDNLNENNINNPEEAPQNPVSSEDASPKAAHAQSAEASEVSDVVDEIPGKPFNLKKEVFEWFYTIAIALVIAFIIKGFLFDFVRVEGDSMFPTLHNSDMLIVRKIGYSPKQGDIIILDANYKNREEYYDNLEIVEGKKYSEFEKFFHNFKLGKNEKKLYYVKRIIALPGQTVDIKDGNVYVDGEILDEYYLKDDLVEKDGKYYIDGRKTDIGKYSPDTHYYTQPYISASTEYPITVEDGYVFVLGDNRNNSKDSRSPDLGQVPYDAIMGKAVFSLFPFDSFGTL